MRRIDFTDQHGNRFRRISKAEAWKRWRDGKQISVCPAKLRPGFPFSPHMDMSFPRAMWEISNRITETPALWYLTWTRMIREFGAYNCSHETGYYPAFYVTSFKGDENE